MAPVATPSHPSQPTQTTPPNLPKTYRAAVILTPNAPLTLETRPLPTPGRGQVLVRVLACGVCGTDVMLRNGGFSNAVFPRVSGHEVVGDVVALGPESGGKFDIGDRVGGAWHGGHDNMCAACQRGLFQMCDNAAQNGIQHDGGWAEYVVLRTEAAVRVPKDMDPVQAAPLLCAGVTVFNSMRKLHIEQGALVAVQGVGGLGHLAVQYAARMGYRVVVLSRGGTEKRAFAFKMGAHEFIDTSEQDAAAALQEMGGAAMICATAPSPKAVSPLVGGLRAGGKLLVLAPMGPVQFDTTLMTVRGLSIHGFPAGHALDTEEAIRFARDHGVECVVQRYRLDEVNEAVRAVEEGTVRYRGVLVL